jgi:hypothetical protein
MRCVPAWSARFRSLKARSEDQAGEIALAAGRSVRFEQYDGKSLGSLSNSKIALKAKLGSAQAQADQQSTTITRLRAELAAAHERLARQAAHFMDECPRRRGAVPASGQVRRPQRISNERRWRAGLANRQDRASGHCAQGNFGRRASLWPPSRPKPPPTAIPATATGGGAGAPRQR